MTEPISIRDKLEQRDARDMLRLVLDGNFRGFSEAVVERGVRQARLRKLAAIRPDTQPGTEKPQGFEVQQKTTKEQTND